MNFLFSILIVSFAIFKCSESRIRIIHDETLQAECLTAHNKYRENHENTPPLRLHRNTSDQAVVRIKALAKLNRGQGFATNTRLIFGENFYWYYDPSRYRSCSDAVDLWYKGINQYNYNRPGFTDKSGGFSQVVWKGSKYLGCAMVEDDTRNYCETYLVCNYYPAGNVDSEYPYNVYPQKYEYERPRPGMEPTKPKPPVPSRPQYPDHSESHNRPADSEIDRPVNVDRPVSVDRPGRPSRPKYPYDTDKSLEETLD